MDDSPAMANAHIAHLLAQINGPSESVSRASSPGLAATDEAADGQRRTAPRSFPYCDLLPHPVETAAERDAALGRILEQLYVCLQAADYSVGALHWTVELQAWMDLKFDLPRDVRLGLIRIYYALCLLPTERLQAVAIDKFVAAFLSLTG
jgi:proteasome activator subunit 4